MTRPIVNIADLEFRPFGHGVDYPGASGAPEQLQARIGEIGRRIGAQKLGYNLTVVPPGKRAFPFHSHRVNEEMFFVVEGEGEVRIGEARYPIRRGDVIACPAGGTETAHQIVNTSQADLKYLAVSTEASPEICDYPDSGKFAVMTWDVSRDSAWHFASRPDKSVNYWDGE